MLAVKKNEKLVMPQKKQCTWVEKYTRCQNDDRHQTPGSSINLCDKHHNKLNRSIADLFSEDEKINE